jgi:hypothetical protein
MRIGDQSHENAHIDAATSIDGILQLSVEFYAGELSIGYTYTDETKPECHNS